MFRSLITLSCFVLIACSGEQTTSSSQDEKEKGALSGYVDSVNSARDVQSVADEQSQRMQRSLDESQ